jgi:hypothetical protein
MPGSPNDTGQRYAMDYWTSSRPAGEPRYDFWDDLEEMRAHAQRVLQGGRFKVVILYERGPGPYGWVEIERYPPED